jgi:hypothetical protein
VAAPPAVRPTPLRGLTVERTPASRTAVCGCTGSAAAIPFASLRLVESSAFSSSSHTRGVPTEIRSDNGGEFIAKVIQRLAGITGVHMLHIAQVSPWDNGYADSFHAPLSNATCLAPSMLDGLPLRSLLRAIGTQPRPAKCPASGLRRSRGHRWRLRS